MKIVDGIEMLEVSVNLMGTPEKIYPTLIKDKDNMILVDTGYPNQQRQVQESFSTANLSFSKLNKIILTHQDIDHVGGLPSILKESTQKIEILTNELEKEYIEGEKYPVKLAALEARLEYLPEQMKKVYEALKGFYSNLHVKIGRTLSDGDVLPYLGGITIIFTPGHTPGHICLYHKQSKTLIAGDALAVENGTLVMTSSSINLNNSLYIDSLRKLSNYDIEAVICYHGGLYKGSAAQRILELINN
ncbi:MBL fold metallo-hydrolase [Candidatus Clostridium stratigraminis]|uniref:MBL fold metallo-hydrolase n=1 Tax=Candidatus Clostridium stratigraminis TaxID=3381661 RepID=A0ABW8SZ43_9CLOT